MTQTLIAMVPSAAFTGEPMAVIREMSETEVYQERLRKQEEKRRMEAEKEARSIILPGGSAAVHADDQVDVPPLCRG